VNIHPVNELQARREIVQQFSMLAHDHGDAHGLWAVRARQSKVEGLEADVLAIGKRFAELRDKVRAAGPEHIWDESRPRRRHR
jgi:hypothetical protein